MTCRFWFCLAMAVMSSAPAIRPAAAQGAAATGEVPPAAPGAPPRAPPGAAPAPTEVPLAAPPVPAQVPPARADVPPAPASAPLAPAPPPPQPAPVVGSAPATTPPPPAIAIVDAGPAPAPPARSWHPGILLGIVSLPRPAQLEALVRLGSDIALGVQYSVLPTLTVPGGDSSLQLDATQATFRWFPFHGAFYLGSGAGYQRLKAVLSETVEGGKLRVAADISTFFLSPQLGWLWVTRSAFSIGINLGVQLPLPREPVITETYNGQPLPAQGGSAGVGSSAQDDRDQVRTLARVIMRYPIPNIDLLKIGFVF